MRAEAGLPADSPSDCDVASDDLLSAVRRQRVVDLLASQAHELGLRPEVGDWLTKAHEVSRQRVMVRTLEQTRLAQLLGEHDIDWLSIKGSALAVQTAGHPGARGGGDIDIFISSDDVVAAFEALTANGWVERQKGSTPETWAWRHILWLHNELAFDRSPLSIDVHWRLDPTHDALVDFPTAWSRRETVDVGGIRTDTLALGDAFAHTCHHAAKDDWRWLRSLVDVHRLARNPELWKTAEGSSIEIATLAVTAAVIGLPDSVPVAIRGRVEAVSPRVIRRAVRHQDGPIYPHNPFPAAQSFRDARYRLAASHTFLDVRMTAVAAVLPAKSVEGIVDRSAWVGLPRLFGRRFRWLVARLGGFVRNTVRRPTTEDRPWE